MYDEIRCGRIEKSVLFHVKTNIAGFYFLQTLTNYTISSESLLASTAVRAVTVGTISILVTRTGIRRTFIDIWEEID